jgi:uncharacterized protein (DUF2236 family)
MPREPLEAFLQRAPAQITPVRIMNFVKQQIAQRVRDMTHTRQQPEVFLQPAGDPGLLGPHSSAWQVHAHFMAMMVGGIASLIVQALHPRALAGVWDHSSFRDDLGARLGRTAFFIAATTYGGRAMAEQAMQRVQRIHRQVQGVDAQGQAYRADDPHLLAWVHLAECTSFMRAYDTHGRPSLDSHGQDRYFAEMALLGSAMGTGPMPTHRAACERALLNFRPELRCDERTRYVLNLLDHYPTEPPYQPLMKMVVRAAHHSLPAWVYPLLQQPDPSWGERLWVRQALAQVSAPIQWALNGEGVAAFARQRVRQAGDMATPETR